MSFDEIQHLDFEPGEREVPLRERATLALAHEAERHKIGLMQYAAEKITDVLGEWSGQLDKLQVNNLTDGSGEVWVTIDGMQFRIQVMHLRVNTDNPEVQVTIGAKQPNGPPLNFRSLAELGRLIEDGKIQCATD